MKSPLVSKGLFKSCVGRFLPLWIAFLAAWLLCLILPLGALAPSRIASVGGAFEAGWNAEYIGTLIGCAVAALYSACCVFEYLFNRQAALFAGSLPVSRTALFVTSFLAGLMPLILIEAAVFVVVALMTLLIPAIGIGYCLSWFGLAVGFTFVFYSVAVLCAMLSGTKTTTYYLFLLANAFIVFIELVCRTVASALMWGVSFSGTPDFVWTSPIFGMGYYCLGAADTLKGLAAGVHWVPLALYCLAAVVMLVCAFMLNRRRDLESAGDAIAFRWLKVAAQLLGGVTFGAVMGIAAVFFMGIGDNAAALDSAQSALLAAACFVGGYLGVFFARHCVVKEGHAFKRSLKMGVCVGLVCALFVAGCAADVLKVKRWVPDASDVASVAVDYNVEGVTLTSEEAVSEMTGIHESLLGFEPYVESNDYAMNCVTLTYKLKDGQVVTRSYDVIVGFKDSSVSTSEQKRIVASSKKVLDKLGAVCDSREGVASKFASIVQNPGRVESISIAYGKDWEDYADVSRKDIADFIQNALVPDIDNAGFGREFSTKGKAVGEISITANMAADGMDYRDFTLRDKNCPAIAKWLKEHYGADILG